MAKVLFINPTVRQEDVPRHVPYGIALLAAIAIEKGHLVQIYDENAWRTGDDTLREVLLADDWEVVALGGITTAYGAIRRMVPQIRELCPNTVIMLGGGVLTSMPRDILKWLPDVDIGVVGEAFVTFPELLAMIDDGGNDWLSIKGTAVPPARADVRP
jgi:anaerobic magnesium-protoporphyrin IX monomethyl ester cyclase